MLRKLIFAAGLSLALAASAGADRVAGKRREANSPKLW